MIHRSTLLRWSQERRAERLYITSGKPMQIGVVESFNCRPSDSPPDRPDASTDRCCVR